MLRETTSYQVFLRVSEYNKNVLLLTTNRVGIFDEASISCMHVQIHYPDLDDEEREVLWATLFCGCRERFAHVCQWFT